MKPITEQRRQELIADCQKEIGTLMLWLECGPLRDRSKTESELLRQQIALASLTAVRAGWGLRSLQEDCYGSWLTTEPREQAYLDCQPHKYENVGLYTAPPVPVIKLPEKLPCDVRFDPGMIFRKGVLVQTMLDALVRRDDYEKELAELSEDERKARQEKISEFLNGLGE